jgi:hypothetical protein
MAAVCLTPVLLLAPPTGTTDTTHHSRVRSSAGSSRDALVQRQRTAGRGPGR